MRAAESPLRLTFEAGNEYWDAIVSLALARFLTGEHPFAEELRAANVARAADLVPIGSVVRRVIETETERALAEGPGWSALVQRFRNGTADISVTAASDEALTKAVADIRARVPLLEPSAGSVPVEFWYADTDCRRSLNRRIDAPRWADIAGHYAASVRGSVGDLLALTRLRAGGRLLLWHGPPGTGKTTAIRALARGWAGWCRTLFVIDPERFLGEAGYLVSVLLGADDHDDDQELRHWRLIVLEDADELLRADAKRTTGQSLSRLLNVADGFIGQGINALILITTNEPLGRLHPAVVRPGRCLAEVEFPALASGEAAGLLGPDHPSPGELTLAEVFRRRGEVTHVGPLRPPGGTGQYL